MGYKLYIVTADGQVISPVHWIPNDLELEGMVIIPVCQLHGLTPESYHVELTFTEFPTITKIATEEYYDDAEPRQWLPYRLKPLLVHRPLGKSLRRHNRGPPADRSAARV